MKFKYFHQLFSYKFLCLVLFTQASFGQSLSDTPKGFAGENGGTTGGTGGAVVVVDNLTDFQDYASRSGRYQILVRGEMGNSVNDRIDVASDKTIFGLPGAKLTGGIDIHDVRNVIVRNLIIQGPGAEDVDGLDAMNISGSENVWIDHMDIRDGQDGNLDVINGSNYVTISWTRFSYSSLSDNHMYNTLVGNSSSKTSDRGKLKTTIMSNWWDNGVIERMPRVRFGQVHVVNNLFRSNNSNYCVRAGIEADIFIEANAFIGVDDPIDLYNGNYTGVTEQDNLFENTSGDRSGDPGKPSFTPPYAIDVIPAEQVEAVITAQAGATLGDPRNISSSSVSSSSNSSSSSSSVGTSSSQISSSTVSSSSVSSSSSLPSSSAQWIDAPFLNGNAIWEAEENCTGAGAMESEHAGFSGSGYYNFDNESDSYMMVKVNSAEIQTISLKLRYANGSSADRMMNVEVQGENYEGLLFTNMPEWDQWDTTSIQVSLGEGIQEIVLRAADQTGGPNLDQIALSGNVNHVSCDATVETLAPYQDLLRVNNKLSRMIVFDGSVSIIPSSMLRSGSTVHVFSLQGELLYAKTIDLIQGDVVLSIPGFQGVALLRIVH